MPFERITFRPGINKQATRTLNEGGWSDGSLIRFMDGLPQPIGGWVRTLAVPFNGACRALHAWVTLAGVKLLALGTSTKLYIAVGDTLYDITPAGLASGLSDVPIVAGWGSDAWGSGTFGTARSVAAPTETIRLWTLDHWGEELVACVQGGAIYRWAPASGYGTPATVITGSPAYSRCILVGMPERHLIAFGAEAMGVYDPMLVRWSDVENYNVWTATATNSAGSFRIQGGSLIRAALAGPQEILIWTDTVLYAMRFEGLPFVYGFFQQGHACGIIAPGAACVLNSVAYWMGVRGFFRYAGAVQPMPCTVWDAVFYDLNVQQRSKIKAAPNMGFNQVAWHYPSKASLENDSYVAVNVLTGEWTQGKLARTAWIDAEVFGNPLGAAPNGQLYTHEFGTDADGAGLPAFVESGFFDIAAGEEFTFLDKLIPDFADQSGSVAVTLKAQSYPNGPVTVKGPYMLDTARAQISPRIRGRQVSVRLESNAPGAFWRLGALRLRLAGDGRK